MKIPRLIRTFLLAVTLLRGPGVFCIQAHGAMAGDVDLSFDPGSGVNGTVRAIALQPDGKMIIGGEFTMVKSLLRYNLARLNADGSGDPTFVVNPNSGMASVKSLALQADGKVLVGFHQGMARLNADGSEDTGFPRMLLKEEVPVGVLAIGIQSDGRIVAGGTWPGGLARFNTDGSSAGFSGVDGVGDLMPGVYSIAVQPDGKVLVAGSFIRAGGEVRFGVARFNSDGTADTDFVPATGPGTDLYAVASQTDGKVLIGGYIRNTDGSHRNTFDRLNADGSFDVSFHPGDGPNTVVHSIAVQSDSRVLCGGEFSAVNGTPRNRLARFHADGTLDGSFDPGPGPRTDVFALAVQPDGRVIAGGDASANFFYLSRLHTDGSLDRGFVAGAGVGGAVISTLVQPDGKVIITGTFRYIDDAFRAGVARLNADGSLDRSFDAGPANRWMAYPNRTALQPDGNVLIGGAMFTAGGEQIFFERLHPDGTLDATFNPGAGLIGFGVRSFTLQPDGKILCDGNYGLSTDYYYGVFRLHADGSLDESFSLRVINNGSRIDAIAVQPDGKVLVGGGFTLEDGSILNLARFHADGRRDHTFSVDLAGGVDSIALQPDGRIVVGGALSPANDPGGIFWITRLHADGSRDSSFQVNPYDAGDYTGILGARSITLQPDGKILALGYYFLGLNGDGEDDLIQGIYRLHADGSVDDTFDPGLNPNVGISALTLQADGNLLLSGGFLAVGGVVRPGVARLLNDPPPVLDIKTSHGWAVLSWPAHAAAWHLQETADPALPGSWAAVSQPPDTSGGRLSVTVQVTAPHRFFRLKFRMD